MKILALILFLATSQALAVGIRKLPPHLEYVPGELLVVFKSGLGMPVKTAAGLSDPRLDLHAAAGTHFIKRLEHLDVDRVRLAPGSDEGAVIAKYMQNSMVKKVERNGIFHAAICGPGAGPCDALYTSGMEAYYDRIHATQAFNAGPVALSFSAQIIVAVVDTGLFQHSEMDGVTTTGINFVNLTGTTDDDEGHGSFVSGIIAAVTNTTGIAGVFFDSARVRIMPVKVLDSSGSGSSSDVATGIIYAADHGAQVINMSIEFGADETTVENAVNYAYHKGVFLVAAAGNEGGSVGWPAAYSNVMSAAALDHTENPAYYSNFGKVDISAPGGDGISFDPGPCHTSPAGIPDELWGLCNSSGGYAYGAGTSFASPMVAAAAALLLSQNPARSPTDLYRILSSSTSATAMGSGYNQYVGWGELNVYSALSYVSGSSSALSPSGPALKVYNWPNPFNPDREGITHFTFALAAPADAEIRVVDMAGNLVYDKKYSAAQTIAGPNIEDWDGRNGKGQAVANGVYIVTLSSGGQKAKNRVAVLR